MIPTIRTARPSDLPDVLEFIRALSLFHGETATIRLETLQQAFFDDPPQAIALVAEAGGRLVGYAGLVARITLHTGLPRADLQQLFVTEKMRGRGIGRALITATGQVAKTAGALGMTIGTDPDNKTAQAAYRAMGLSEVTGAGPRFWVPLDEKPSTARM